MRKENSRHIETLTRARVAPRMVVVTVPFVKVHKHIPSRKSYRGSYSNKFWQNFTRSPSTLKPESWISADRLREVAARVNYDQPAKVALASDILTNGAVLGCRGSARLGTEVRNASSCHEYGERVLDSLEEWLRQKLVLGPLTRQELTELFPGKQVTVNPIGVRLKANGKARIIVDMSSPHLDKDELDLDGDVPSSVNSGIDKRDWPAVMATTKDVVRLMYKKGAGALFCKVDWASAYKHIHVASSDLQLQVISIGGRFFVERALVFGCVSSPGLYDFIAKLVISLVATEAGTDPDDVEQCLDDVVMVTEARDPACQRFYHQYRATCKELGIQLAPEGPDKAFPPTTEGTILGIEYDWVSFKWRMPEVKASYMCETLYDIIDGVEITNRNALKLVGRINHYFPLVPGGKMERFWLAQLGDSARYGT